MSDLLQQALRYGSVGLVNTAFGLSVIWVLMFFGVGPYPANAMGYAAGLVVSFLLNRSWTFRAQHAGWPVLRFGAAFVVAYGANLGVLALGLRIAPEAVYVLQLVCTGVYAVLFFLLCRYFVFRPRASDPPA